MSACVQYILRFESVDGDENDGGSIGDLSGAPPENRHCESTLAFLQRTALDAQMSSDKVLDIARKYPQIAVDADVFVCASDRRAALFEIFVHSEIANEPC